MIADPKPTGKNTDEPTHKPSMESLKRVIRPFVPLSRIRKSWEYHRKWLAAYGSPFVHFYPAGHYYSPLPDIQDVLARRAEIFDREVEHCRGIALNEDRQQELLNRFREYAGDWPFRDQPGDGLRYYRDNHVFETFDALVLFCFLRCYQPRRVVEIGSGLSSAVMLDTSERFLEVAPRFTFVEPYPERLLGLLSAADLERITLIEEPIQKASTSEIEQLERDDLLFVDSSHVSKIGSDLNYILFEILPALRPGVIVHFHDIHWPFEYPEDWVMLGRAWNEAYLLRAFLQFNESFEILFFNSFMQRRNPEAFEQMLPSANATRGSSLWLRRRDEG